jgi:hypothetical protein
MASRFPPVSIVSINDPTKLLVVLVHKTPWPLGHALAARCWFAGIVTVVLFDFLAIGISP